ncbi:MAG: hypothetical protein ABSC95_21195 [Acetobacteraceae bacterium]
MFIIILVLLAAFMLTMWQYFTIDPKRRILNLRFVMMVCAIIAAIGYPLFNITYPGDRHASWLFLGLGLLLLVSAYILLRNMPPRDQY